ncbi:hypothetical protein GOP47_0012344 [Adiantum capillus-veneris]|uniref:Uncharacterized protein n=1 Tax=Adiantum capillus-veneris TaxID=13818 RepID=A0A9D4UQH6_ADICA|nr:hypothetical protein GOP47_0012344 [Adiantum capillus-veneris]
MVTMVSQRLMDNLSCMLRANGELQVNMQAHGIALDNNMQAQVDSELARENTLLRQQLLEAIADNDAISRSLQERVHSLANTTDAKIKAETEVKMLQVQLKSMEKDLDGHKYELHILRKQLQIRNEEKEHHKKASDASYKKHLENVKKIARLEYECQRLRGLIRQRVPGPAAIAQMRAECDIHVKMGIKKKAPSVLPSSRTLHNSSSLQAQKEIESLRERLLSVEDEAKSLKEAVTKRTSELQEARQLCARTVMKLSAAQALVESVTSATNTASSTPSTPTHHLQSEFDSDHHHHGLPSQDMIMCHNNDDDELDEISCAESWASALFAELSNLSNLQEDTASASVTSGGVIIDVPENYIKSYGDVIPNSNEKELEINSVLETVHRSLLSVGETLLTPFNNQANSPNLAEEINDSVEGLCGMKDATHNDRNHDLLEEILQIKGLLMDINAAMEMGNGCTKQLISLGSCMNGDEGHTLANFKGERGLSRLRFNSLEDEHEVSDKFSEEGSEMEPLATKFIEHTDEMEGVCTKLGEETANIVDMGTQFSERPDLATKFSDKTGTMAEDIANNDTNIAAAGDGQLNLAAAADEKVAGEESDVAAELVELQGLLHSAQADLELARGRIATLEAELARCLQEKADVAYDLADTRSLKQSLEAELACAVASVEDLKLQLSCLQALNNDQPRPGNLVPCEGGPPTLAQLDAHTNGEEDQELAAARAQLADCQRSIHVIRKQIASEMENVAIQDVINDEQVQFDTSSESSKSTDLSSHLPSPTLEDCPYFEMPSSNTIIVAKPTEDAMTDKECNAPYFPPLLKSCALQKDDNLQPLREVESNATKQHAQQNKEQSKGHDDDIKTKAFMYLTRSSSKDLITKTPQILSKPSKSSTTSRISEFFNRAKSTTRGSEL